MSDSCECFNWNSDNSNSSLYKALRNCANLQSQESLPNTELYDNDALAPNIFISNRMISTNSYSASGISSSSFASDDLFRDNILEENGRISLAYENLRTWPHGRKFANQAKFLDLSYNNFQSITFLSFFEELHTLILDRNSHLDVNTLPYLPNLKILWLNNCNISNVTDWVHRIASQCPTLEHLSMMGNPGIKNPFSYCILTSPSLLEPPMQTTLVCDYREYVLHMLSSLEYLDGIPRSTQLNQPLTRSNQHSSNNVPSTTSSAQNDLNSRKTSPTLNFKDLFRLAQRKNSYQSSSTN